MIMLSYSVDNILHPLQDTYDAVERPIDKLRRMDGRDQFESIFISMRRRARYKDK